MARMARLVVPFYPHHVTQRGNRRQNTFFCEHDYRQYLDLLAEAKSTAGVDVWAYCLMPNHVHLVVVPEHQDGLSALFGEAHRRYTRRVNLREGWRGHLWQERFHSFVMDECHLISAVRYVELNPVRAGICARAEEWPWSSAAAHIKGYDDGLVSVAPMLARVQSWSSYLATPDDRNSLDSIRRHTRTGRPVNTTGFIDKLETLTGRCLRPRARGPKTGS